MTKEALEMIYTSVSYVWSLMPNWLRYAYLVSLCAAFLLGMWI